MSAFSELLSYYISQKNIKVYSILQYCGLDRSTMYQIINGKRTPSSMKVFQKIAEALRLTPLEYQKFEEAYIISRTGPETYYSRKSVENFILNFPTDFSSTEKPTTKKSIPSNFCKQELFSGSTALYTQVELNHYIHHILLNESDKPEGKIALLIQPDYHFLFSLLPSLKPKGTLSIEHIIRMSSSGQMDERNELYNLKYLTSILPMYIGNMNYQPYYFYENIHSYYHNFNGFPCIILTSTYAITCTADYQSGILHTDLSICTMLWDLYYSYQSQCVPLFHVMGFVPDNGVDFVNNFYGNTPTYILQPEACLTPFITIKLLGSALLPIFSDNNAVYNQIKSLLQANRHVLDTKKVYIYFTKDGLNNFVHSGRIKEIPSCFYRILTKAERISILESILPYCQKGTYRLLKRPFDHLSQNLHLCVNQSSGYLLFNNLEQKTLSLIFNETSLISAFVDYLENIDEKYLYSKQETEDFVKELILKLS